MQMWMVEEYSRNPGLKISHVVLKLAGFKLPDSIWPWASRKSWFMPLKKRIEQLIHRIVMIIKQDTIGKLFNTMLNTLWQLDVSSY